MSVNLSPVGGAGAQFCDNNGNPLNGGKLYTYSAGTTTPAATYTSAAGSVFHTNPIILNAGGRVPDSGEIWLSDNISYKFVLKTSADVLIATWDNINGINSNFVNYTIQEEVITATAGQTVFNLSTITYAPGTNSLAVYIDGVNQIVTDSYIETDANTVTFVSGLHDGALVKFTTAVPATGTATTADLVTYNPPFTGAVAESVEAKLAQTVSVKDFGAVGDGVTDDTAAILSAVANDREINLVGGTYAVTGLVLSNLDNFKISGPGKLILKAASNKAVIDFQNCTNWTMEGVEIDGNKTNNAPAARPDGSGIKIYPGCANYTVINCHIHDNYSGAGINCVDNGSDTTVLETNGRLLFNVIEDCGLVGGLNLSDGIFANADNSIVFGNTIRRCTDYGIAGDYSHYLAIQYNNISDVLVGIGVLGAFDWDVGYNTVVRTELGIAVTLSGNPAVAPYVSQDVSIHHNTIQDIPSTALLNDGVFVDPSAQRVTITLNNIQDVNGRGVATSSDNTLIAFNRIRNATGGAVRLGGNASKSLWNELSGTGASITDAGTVSIINGVEKGTFTPEVEGTTTAGTCTYNRQRGRYIKNQQFVEFWIEVDWASHTGTGDIRITGLPYASFSASLPVEAVVNVAAQNLTFTGQLSALVIAGQTYLQLKTSATGAALTGVPMDATAKVWVTGSYEAAA